MQTLRRPICRATLGLGLGLLVLLLVARLGTWWTPWPLSVLDTFALSAFAPFLGVAAVALLLRSRMLIGLSLAALVFFGQQFGPEIASAVGLTSHTIAAEPETPMQLRVLTLNVQAPNDDPTLLVAVVRAHRPDLVVLQEVTASYAAALDRAIGDAYPFSFRAGVETDHEGAGTWSRLPLSDPEAFRLGDWGNELHRVRVSTPWGRIGLYNVHLPNPTDPGNADEDRGLLAAMWAFDPARRDAELDALADRLAGDDAPFIIAGDFNVAAGSRAYRRWPTGWRDAFAEAGRGFGPTYPAPDHEHEGDEPRWIKRSFALIRIDYILTSGDLRPRRAWTEELVDTDHLAVLADLDLSGVPTGRDTGRETGRRD